jgi:hypothetical protein
LRVPCCNLVPLGFACLVLLRVRGHEHLLLSFPADIGLPWLTIASRGPPASCACRFPVGFAPGRPLKLNVGPLKSVVSVALSLSSSALCLAHRLGWPQSASSAPLPSPSCSSASSFFFGLRYAPGLMSSLRSLSSASALARSPAAACCPSCLLLLAPVAFPGVSSVSSSAASISRLRFPPPLPSHLAALRVASFGAVALATACWLSSLRLWLPFWSASSRGLRRCATRLRALASSAPRPNPSVNRTPCQLRWQVPSGLRPPVAGYLKRWAS